MTVSVADLDRLERECQHRINAIASAGRRRLATGDPEAPDPERVAQALLRVKVLLDDVAELLQLREVAGSGMRLVVREVLRHGDVAA